MIALITLAEIAPVPNTAEVADRADLGLRLSPAVDQPQRGLFVFVIAPAGSGLGDQRQSASRGRRFGLGLGGDRGRQGLITEPPQHRTFEHVFYGTRDPDKPSCPRKLLVGAVRAGMSE
ncbi:hypothetical protein ACTJJE_05525 [Mycolicibacterium sp. 22603]|uniref:hypothetical protein n=1 Tax=Mycolicibacterium sp. 22603 TaxID=3453950 RepID=UPI003F87649E